MPKKWLTLPTSAVTTKLLLQHDFLVMMWIKPAVMLRALRQGYATMLVGQPPLLPAACCSLPGHA